MTNITTDTHATDGYTSAITNLPPDAFLGTLMWFSINQADVNLDAARDSLEALGLADVGLRKILRPVDAFRKASREVAHKFKPIDDTRAELLVRPVGNDGEQAHRHLILERAAYQAGKRRRVFYEKVGEIVFTRGFKKDGTYTGYSVEIKDVTEYLTSPLHPDEQAWVDNAFASFEGRFHHLLSHMDSHAVRTFVREQIDRLDGVCVKESGGVYFIRQENADEVEKLGKWIRQIGSQYHGLPLLNLQDQREMILQAFEDETVAESQRLMGEIADILKEGGKVIEEKTFDAYALRAAEMSRRIKEYNEMLGLRADVASINVELFTAQLVDLSGRIRQPGQSRRRVA